VVQRHSLTLANDPTARAVCSSLTEGERRWFLRTLATMRVPGEAVEQRFTLEAGGTAVVPMTAPHTFRVDSETARMLNVGPPLGPDD
jgi:hypothetical protein